MFLFNLLFIFIFLFIFFYFLFFPNYYNNFYNKDKLVTFFFFYHIFYIHIKYSDEQWIIGFFAKQPKFIFNKTEIG